jgi:hypothetical protein
MHQPGIMLGTLKVNLKFTKADTPTGGLASQDISLD